jgi:predicted metal-dependent enzyme (double-stranded beta helix superfamily)
LHGAPPRLPVSSLSCGLAEKPDAALDELIDGINDACADAAPELPHRVFRLLQSARPVIAKLPSTPRGDTYTRHILHSDPGGRFTVVAIVWQPGQYSPVHAHYTWCAYQVMHGGLTEQHYKWNDKTNQAECLRTIAKPCGHGAAGHPGLEQIHRLGNAGARPAVSLHVYGIDSHRIATHVNRLVPDARAA